MSHREDKAIAIWPNWILRVEAKKLGPDSVRDGGHGHAERYVCESDDIGWDYTTHRLCVTYGVPGWPELAFWTASMARQRMVSTTMFSFFW